MPSPRYKGNRKKQREFLDAYMRHGNLLRAAGDVGLSNAQHYRWMEQDEGYRLQFSIAQDAAHEIARANAKDAIPILEAKAWHLALIGRARKRFTARGEPVIDPATGRQYVEYEEDGRILLKLLEANHPEKYRNSLQVIQQTGVQVQQIAGDVGAMAATIPPPAEAVQAALHAQIVRQIERGDGQPGEGGNGNGHAHETEGET